MDEEPRVPADWRDLVPVFLLAAAGVTICALLLVLRPDDTTTVLFSLSVAVILLAAPATFALLTFGAPAGVVKRIVPAGVLTGGVLLVAGLVAQGVRALLTFVLCVVGIELITLALWAVVTLLGRLRDWVFRRRRS